MQDTFTPSVESVVLKLHEGSFYPNDWRVPTATAWLKRFLLDGITSALPGSKLLQLYLKYKYNLSSKLSLLPSIHRMPLCTSLIMSVFSTIPPIPADRKVLPSGLLPRVLTSFIKTKINKVTAKQKFSLIRDHLPDCLLEEGVPVCSIRFVANPIHGS